MTDTEDKVAQQQETIVDFITGKPVVLTGAEENRQAMERFLVEEKGYNRSDIVVNEKITVKVGNELYVSAIDLVVYAAQKRFMVIKCAPGSLGSREREILAAARVVQEAPVPYAVVTDGATAIVMAGATGQKTGETLAAVASKQEAEEQMAGITDMPLDPSRREKETILFRSYDSTDVNRDRSL